MIGKYGRMAAVLLALALVVAACGDDDADTTEAPSTTQAGTTTEASEALPAIWWVPGLRSQPDLPGVEK
jgi:hypothetical protein